MVSFINMKEQLLEKYNSLTSIEKFKLNTIWQILLSIHVV